MEQALERAIARFGSQGKLARQIGVSQQTISHWLRQSQRVSAEAAVAIEKATAGEVRRVDLRPDLFAS